MNLIINIKKLTASAQLPEMQTLGSAGGDLHADIAKPITLLPKSTIKIPTGLAMAIPHGFVGLIYARSGLATKNGISPANKVGVIDSDYRGEIIVALCNESDKAFIITPQMRIAQLIIQPVISPSFNDVNELEDTIRNIGGFGSTGCANILILGGV